MRDIIKVIKSFVEQRATGVLTTTDMPRVDILKVSAPTQLAPEIYQPLVSLILQGEKRLVIGSQVLRYTAGHTFISSVDVPVIGEIVQASATAPYLAVRLTFDRSVVADLLREAQGLAESPEERSFCVSQASEDLMDAWLRMLRLMERNDEIAFMAPLLEREILFRLLRGPQGVVLRQVASIDSRFSRIRKALNWIKANYSTALRVADLADLANMSPSSFHRSFKASTGMSPLQYQKHLRLYEARSRLFAERGDVASVALAVGYESLSQFTREYARMFGAPPARDVRSHKKVG
ncbi:MAG: AraC family transcriptional regulator [Burkholderiaceae bacterium]|nr:AraC family transcriptional regulator [Burkholderiaceae bacterium]